MTNKLVSIIAAAVSFLSLSLISCTTTIQEKITSDPPGASIYAGPSPDNLRYIGTTPRTAESTGIYGSAFVPYYYQFKKPGYENSDIIFVPKGPPNRGGMSMPI